MAAAPARTVELADIARARAAIGDVARHTPVLPSLTLSQRTGDRGRPEGREPPAHRLVQDPRRAEQARRAGRRLPPRRRPRAARATTPGRCAQAARVARRAVRGLHAGRGADRRRSRAARTLGAVVHIGGASVDECVALRTGARRGGGHGVRAPVRRPRHRRRPGHARARAARRRRPTSPRSSSRSGGGGLSSGVAIAVKSQRPDIEVVGVQVDTVRRLPGVAARRRAGRRRLGADDRRRHRGQAPGRPHAAARPALARRRGRRARGRRRRGDGAAAWSARSSSSRAPARSASRRCSAARPRPRARGTTVVVLSGGNVDAGLLATSRAATRPRPGGGSSCSRASPTAPARSRACSRSSARAARTSSTSSTCARASTCTCARPGSSSSLETRGRDHADAVLARVRESGYDLDVMGDEPVSPAKPPA